MYLFVCAHTRALEFVFHGMCVEVRGQLAGVGSFTSQVPEIELRLSGLVAGAFSHGAISPALTQYFFFFLSTYYVPGIGLRTGHAVRTRSLPVWADWGHGVQWLGMWTLGSESLDQLFLLWPLSAV